MTTEATTTTLGTKTIELGCLEKREVITTDGRIIGDLTGAQIDVSTWRVPYIVVEVNKDVADAINVKKPVLRTAKANVPVDLVRTIADTVQLNVDLDGLRGRL